MVWNNSTIGLLSANYTIDASFVGYYLSFTVNATRTITLPDPSKITVGCFIACSVISNSGTTYVVSFKMDPAATILRTSQHRLPQLMQVQALYLLIRVPYGMHLHN
jgi:hypothetical protein